MDVGYPPAIEVGLKFGTEIGFRRDQHLAGRGQALHQPGEQCSGPAMLANIVVGLPRHESDQKVVCVRLQAAGLGESGVGREGVRMQLRKLMIAGVAQRAIAWCPALVAARHQHAAGKGIGDGVL